MDLRRLTVGDLMSTAVITVKERETITQADLEMRLAGIRHLPVVDDKNHVVGILSNRDLFRAMGKGDRKAAPVWETMTSNLHTVGEDTPAYRAAATMIERKIGALPVVGDQGQLVGLVTETDFLRVAYEALSGSRGEALGVGA